MSPIISIVCGTLHNMLYNAGEPEINGNNKTKCVKNKDVIPM